MHYHHIRQWGQKEQETAKQLFYVRLYRYPISRKCMHFMIDLAVSIRLHVQSVKNVFKMVS
jgi:hypothetical protein